MLPLNRQEPALLASRLADLGLPTSVDVEARVSDRVGLESAVAV